MKLKPWEIIALGTCVAACGAGSIIFVTAWITGADTVLLDLNYMKRYLPFGEQLIETVLVLFGFIGGLIWFWRGDK